jgi:hypothetical protein
VTFVSGLRRCGKSAVIQAMVDRLYRRPPHYLRLVQAGSGKAPVKGKPDQKAEDCRVASARWLEFHEDRVFEILPDALSEIHKQDRYGAVVIEADADAMLRCAYPYDYRVFVMPQPPTVHEVFRDPKEAAKELRRALDDTAAFASEIFGLLAHPQDDPPEPPEERPDLSGTHMRGFLYSPLGDELATRIQLQQPYHGLVESDVIVVNSAMGEATPATEDCLRRIDHLLSRLSGLTNRRGELFACDPWKQEGKDCKRLFDALKRICVAGK